MELRCGAHGGGNAAAYAGTEEMRVAAGEVPATLSHPVAIRFGTAGKLTHLSLAALTGSSKIHENIIK